MLIQQGGRFGVKNLFFFLLYRECIFLYVTSLSLLPPISFPTGALLGNKLLSQGEVQGSPVQAVGQVNQNTAKALWEEVSGLALADLGMWLVQVAAEGRSSSMSSQPDTACVPLSAPLGCPCLMGGGREGEGVQALCFRHRKYWMIWEQLSEAVQKFCWDCR